MSIVMSLEQNEQVAVDYDPFVGGTLTRVVPTTEPQREIWLANQFGRDASLAFNLSVSLRLRGRLDVEALAAALQVLVDRHDALRANFGPGGETLCIREACEIGLPVTDLSVLDSTRRSDAVDDRVRSSVETPFLIDSDLLFRAELLKLEEEEHLLLLTAHHIVCDGWSWWVIVRELGALYALHSGSPGVTLGAPEDFSEYALAEATRQVDAEASADEAYWLSRFAGEVPVLDLPADHPRPVQRSFASCRIDHVIDAELTSAIRRMGARRGASLFATMLAGFSGLLSRLTGQSRVVVGIPAAGQSVGGHADLIGHCVNTLPLRFDMDTAQPFTQALDDAQAIVLDAFEHQRYTFGTLLGKLRIKRDPSRMPLVSVLFNIDQASDKEGSAFPGLELEVHDNPRSFEVFEMFLNVAQAKGELRIECQYNRDLFDDVTVRRWLKAYEALLRSAVDSPTASFASLPLLDHSMMAELEDLQPTAVPFDRERRMHEVFEVQCDASPARVAAQCGDMAASYLQLESRANRIAHLLRSHGVQHGSLVGLAVDRSTDMLAALLGILKAGAGYVPLDPQFPADRLAYMAEDAGLAALITETRHASLFDLRGRPILALDQLGAELDALPDTRIGRDPLAAAPESIAYVIYTSGSTGRPKGVQVPHRAVSNFITGMQRQPGLDADDRLLAVTTLSFDIAVLELLLPLSVGARVVLAERESVSDPQALSSLLSQRRCTVMQATPATWRLLLDSGWSGGSGFKALCGGEPLAPDLAAQLLSRCSELWNLYGPTETTVWSTCMQVSLPQDGTQAPDIHIGKAIANTRIWILDAQGELCPRGVPGEICIGGDGVTLGYLNRPELTADRFIADRFASPDAFGDDLPAPLLYRTGDLGRWRSDGNLEHMGRLDFQVKIRGYRIELGEIENTLASHPAVARVVALAREDRPGDVRLVTYVVAHADLEIQEPALLAHMRSTLPEYMIPQHVVVLDAIPLLPNGKIDRKSLPPPGMASPSAAGKVAPRNEIEEAVAAIMAEVLGLSEIGVEDDFFSLGGHSLLGARMISRIAQQTGVALPLRTLFDAPTVARLSEAVTAAGNSGNSPAAPRVERCADQRRAPLSLMQHGMWMFDQLNPGQAAYNIPSAHRLRGPLDVAVLDDAFRTIVRRQASLRTQFAHEGDGAVQHVLDEVEATLLPLEDLSDLPESEREGEVMRRMIDLTAHPIPLDQAPLFRVRLFKLSDQEHFLFIMVHHIVWDGLSVDLFFQELAEIYEASRQGRAPVLPELERSYCDFATWHSRLQDQEAMRPQLEHWVQHLAGELEPLHLPEDFPRPARPTGNGSAEPIHVDASLTSALRQIGSRVDASLFMTLLTAYYLLLHRLTGQRDIIVGLPVRNHVSEDLDKVMGFFVNVLPLRLQVDPELPFTQMVARVRQSVFDCFSNPDVPVEQLVRELNLPRDPSRSPVYQALFSFQDIRDRRTEWGGLHYEHVMVPHKTASNDLSFWCFEDRNGLVVDLNYNTDILSAESGVAFHQRFIALLEVVRHNPDVVVGDANVLSDADIEALARWNATTAELPVERTVHAMFMAQAKRTPSRTAVSFNGTSTTYAQLDSRSSRIADVLHARGVKPGDLVGISLDRDTNLIAGMLAILKVGAGYVPMDPAYPADRLQFMAEDAGLTLVLSHSSLLDVLGWPRDRLLLIDADVPAHDAQRPIVEMAADATGPESVAYVIYTSGSTGKPKGVRVPHRAVANFLSSMRREPGLAEDDRLLAVTTISFDIAVLEIFLPLSLGAEIVLASREAAMEGSEIAALLEASGANVMQATPATWHMLLESGWTGKPGFKALCGGEPLPPTLARQLQARCGEVWNMYGPTETTVWSTCSQVATASGRPGVPEIHIGTPIDNTTVWILDARGQVCPIGVPGEICVGGEGVTLGYLDRAELTADRFIPDRFSMLENHRSGSAEPMLYRTGDRGRWRADGKLEHLGRLDFQVKVRGHRIELGEIENTLTTHPTVAHCVAVVREDRPGDVRLVAYVVAGTGQAADPVALSGYSRGRLPDYMIPQHIVAIEAMPLLPNGKIDRKALPLPQETMSLAATCTKPRSDAEQRIAAVMADVLGVAEVGINDDFFSLGGHSLLAIRLANRVGKELDISLPLRTIFDAPTVARLADAIYAKSAGEKGPATQLEVVRQPDQRFAQLSLMQQRLWMLEQIQPGLATYSIPSAHRLHGELDATALDDAFRKVVERQSSLRTQLEENDHGAVQHVLDEVEASLLPIEDLSTLPEAGREAEMMRRMSALMGEPIPLDKAPLFRARLFKLSGQEHVLFFMVHHAVWDGVSLNIFCEEMAELYQAYSEGRPSVMPELKRSYADFSAWHIKQMDAHSLQGQLAHWKQHLAGELEPLHLPEDHPRPAQATGKGGSELMRIDGALSSGLREIAKRADATLFMTLLTAYYVLLHRLTGQRDLVVGLPVRNQMSDELDKTMGFFANILPLRMQVDPELSFVQMVGRVRQAMLDCFSYPEVPFEYLVREMQIPRDPSRTPIYQAVFAIQDIRERRTSWGNLKYEHLMLPQCAAANDLSMWLFEGADELTGDLNYNADIICAESAALIHRRFIKMLEEFHHDPEVAVGDASALSDEDLDALARWNSTASEVPMQKTVHATLAAQAEATPGRTAIRSNDESVSYAQLDARSTRIADALVARGVRAGDLVGVSLDRHPDLIASMIAVLKTGAAYVPLDPAYPGERLQFMVEDAKLTMVVAERELAGPLAMPRERILLLDADAAEIDSAPSTITGRQADPAKCDSVAYVIYTSGSTGKPKGVRVPHGAVVNFLHSMRNEPGLGRDDRLLAVTTTSFDISVLEIFLPLSLGAEVVLATREVATDGDEIVALLEREGITVMQATPATWRMLVESGWQGREGFKALCGGEPLPADLAVQLLSRCSEVWNMYGPTETTVWSTCAHIKAGVEGAPPDIHIGKPIANTTVWVLDPRGQICPIGVSGEIYIGGDGVTLGYLHRPELTDERFVVDNFVSRPGSWPSALPARLYRTGDRGRWRRDGVLEHEGRLDFQVKIRGHRIELGEIESILVDQAGVARAVAVAREDLPGDVRLVAYVVAQPAAPLDERILIASLRELLPHYMVPQHVVVLDSIPQLPNGKIDRKSLPQPVHGLMQARPDATRAEEAVRDGRIDYLIRIWSEVLGMEAGPADNFFDLGGHSMLAVQMANRVAKETGVKLRLLSLATQSLAQAAATLPVQEPAAIAASHGGWLRYFKRILGRAGIKA